MKTREIIADLTQLLGANVSIFGQPTILESEISPVVVDTRKIFEVLQNNEVDYIVSKLDHEHIEKLEEAISEMEEALESLQDTIDYLSNVTDIFSTDNCTESIIEELEAQKEELEAHLDSYREELEEAQEDYQEEELDDTDEYLEWLDELYGLKEITCGNSYNWLGNVSHHFNYRVYENGNGCYYVELRAHRYGDVRCNYTDTAVYKFEHDCEFWEKLYEANHYETVEIDDEEYEIEVNSMRDTYEVYQDGEYICEVSGCDIEEITEKIKEYLA